MMLPNLIIAGAPKSGTSSLFRWLADHPDVLGSNVKETQYFADPGTHVFNASRHLSTGGIEGYATFFGAGKRNYRLVVEATPTYLYSELARRNLPKIESAPHFIFLLREPVRQMQSLFRYFQSNWSWIPPSMRFSEFVTECQSGSARFGGNELAENALRNAAYVNYLCEWRDACGADRMHVFIFEDAFADEFRFMRRLAAQFGIDPAFYDTYHFPRENQTYEVRSRMLQDVNMAIRARLPQGVVYRAARCVYRALNTRVQPGRELLEDDAEILRGGLFHHANERLSREFNLDLGRWLEIDRARRARRAITAEQRHAIPAE
jgi:hypothetical protein